MNVLKLSDEPNEYVGDVKAVQRAKEVFGIELMSMSGGWGMGCASAREIVRPEGTRPACGNESENERESETGGHTK
ncbi:hypothetical protein M427DRAFT_322602 [Gonapodya prolifera JEL478]|uniref:Uncharacterized protein n=1 Tax=Gonapodya prolifera (strain JEL478) TaxID=1344416 RepID=A0A139AFJ0_GONPJ|nr:hypothetical protein M427DRAFT_322602 [Gonapodya prolifera JEL478]|eukprot:KXS15557.1 hypothetical protein M427DRAFT_322602 [Gonapodya prolifera JEL478]